MFTEKISKKYKNKEIIKDLTINIPENKKICLFGKSGSGKTTLINILCGIEKTDKGKINFDSNKKRISVGFQEPRLLPWFTTEKNLSLVSPKYKYYMEKLGLLEFKDNYPRELSGGTQQKVSIARSLSVDFDILILDEPFKGIDIVAKYKIIKFMLEETKDKTVILITHDIEEAVLFSDEIKFLNGPPLKEINSIQIPKPFKERDKKYTATMKEYIQNNFIINLK